MYEKYIYRMNDKEDVEWKPRDISRVFEKLRSNNIVTCEGACCCHGCTGGGISMYMKEIKREDLDVKGFAYYIEQDRPEKINIAYGDDKGEPNKNIGKKIVQLLDE